MSKEVKYKIAFMSPLVFVIAFLVIGVFSIQTSTPIVHAATCPADGTGDGDGDDTKITISSNTTWAATDGTAWDCSGLDLDVTGTAILTLAGTIASGYIPQLTIDNISVGSSASISGNVMGCVSPNNYNDGYGPNGSNVCTISTAGYGRGLNNVGGAQGAGYGGAGGLGTSTNLSTGGLVYGTSLSPLLFGSSGGGTGSGGSGGAGGGIIRLNISGNLINDGEITANGGAGGTNGTNRSGGGGSGGSIYITSGALSGTGTFSANGGDGGDGTTYDGGGGGGGRIHIEHNGGSYSPSSSNILVSVGLGHSTNDGKLGTAYIKDTSTSRVDIFHGFTYNDTDHTTTTWVADSSATNQYCDSSAVSPSITATYLTLGGTLLCNNTNAPSLTGFDFSGTSSFAISSGAIMNIITPKANVDFNLGGNSSWTNVNLTMPREGLFTINDAVSITLAGSNINANAQWTGISNLTIDSSSSISGNVMGCVSPNDYNNGYGPNGSNVCTISTAGYGRGLNNVGGAQGAGYGGAGGLGTSTTLNQGGLVYGTSLSPSLFGSSGGGAGGGGSGGAGGGAIRLNISGTLTNNGLISANGGAGGTNGTNRSGGGGSGGSIYITSGALSGTGTFSANGGDGGDGTTYDGGGGGGGRIHIEHNGGSYSPSSSNILVSVGLGHSTNDGKLGTAYIKDTSTSRVDIFHGFTYNDTDHTTTTWVADSSATNQYCDSSAVSPSITATYLTLGGTLLCNNTNAPSLTGFDFSGTSSFAISSGAIVDILTTGANTDLTIGNNPTWSNVNLTFAPSGLLTMDDYISLVLTGNSTINGNAQWSNLVNLTIDSGSTLGSDSRGCASPNDYNNGYGPNGFNVCAISTAGYGRGLNNTGGAQGAGYGGAGGLGTSTNLNTGGLTYGSDTDPILFGSSGGGTGGGGSGGAGGGVIRLNISGTLTNNGLISANGGAGGTNGTNRSGGGGSGGSINITVGTYACDTGSLSVAGGAGGNGTTYDGGGGGGGRLKIIATTDSSTGCTIASLSAATVAAGGLGPDTAVDGSVGTLYTGSSNNPPTVDSVRVSYSANGTNVSPLVPSLGTVKSFHVNGVVSDTDGFADIQNVATVFYRSGATGGVACSSDKNDCYSIASCTLSGGSSNSINYDCDVSADYFIDPTDSGAYSAQTWNVRVSVSDATSTVDDDSYTNEVQTTTGIGAPDTIDFTNLALGATSPTSISYEVTNYGNSAVDTNVSMENPQTCTIGTIPINKIKYGRTDTDYASLEYILSATPSATNLSLPQQTNDVTAVTDMLYWKLQAPAEAVGGTCSGTININAIAG